MPYHPCGKAISDPMINRQITPEEYAVAVRDAIAAGTHRLDH
jgi:uncharacterized Fe-S radical SAM superfamily protein PflX